MNLHRMLTTPTAFNGYGFDPVAFLVVEDEWYHGNGSEGSAMYVVHKKGFRDLETEFEHKYEEQYKGMCCLGHLGVACGLTRKEMEGMSDPSDTYYDRSPYRFALDRLVDHWKRDDTDAIQRTATDVCKRLMTGNDMEEKTDITYTSEKEPIIFGSDVDRKEYLFKTMLNVGLLPVFVPTNKAKE